MFLFKKSFLVFIFACNLIINHNNCTAMENNLKLEIIPNSSQYKIGDQIELQYVLTNIGTKDVVIVSYSVDSALNWINIYGKNKIILKKIRKIIYEPKMLPDANDYVAIKPGNFVVKKLHGKFVVESIKKETENKYLKGLFLDLGTSSFLLQGPDRYTIKGKYVGHDEWRERGHDEFKYSDVWSGVIESEEVEIELVE